MPDGYSDAELGKLFREAERVARFTISFMALQGDKRGKDNATRNANKFAAAASHYEIEVVKANYRKRVEDIG